jgi:hypothetical protein
MTTSDASSTDTSSESASDRSDAFRYYEDQWTQLRHRETQRSSLTLQIVVLAAASVATYGNLTEPWLRCALGVLVSAVGLLGYFATVAHEEAANLHELRARAARAFVPTANAIAEKYTPFPPLARYYVGLSVLVILLGVSLTLGSFVPLRQKPSTAPCDSASTPARCYGHSPN